MSNYTKTTNFASKDNLSPGNPLKIVKGTEIDTEFNNIATAVATKTDNSAAAITGGSITGITDLAVADGGTGASTAANARTNLGAAASGANSDITSITGLTTALTVAQGGTGVTSSTGTGNVVLSNSPTLVTPALGTPASGTATNLTGLPISTGVSGLGTGVATFLGTPSSANLASAVTDETGSGALVFANSPTLVTPALGTPSALVGTNITGTASGLTAGNVTTNANLTGAVTSVGNATSLGSFSSANLLGALTDETGTGSAVFATSPTLVTPILGTPTSATLTNATGLPISTGVSGLGTGVATALAVNVGSSGAPLVNGGVLGTPSSGTATNLTGLPISTGVSGLGTGVATALAVNVGSAGAAVVNGGALGTPSGGTATNLTGLPLTTGVTGTLPVANGGTGTATPSIVAGTNVTVTGTWPNQTIAASGGGGGTPGGSTTQVQYNNAGAFGGITGATTNGTALTLVAPILGTPASATLTNATGLPISTGVSGLGTGIATALAVNTGSAGAPVLFNGALGTPTSGTVTNLTGTASININGTVGATSASTGAFTTLSASGLTSITDVTDATSTTAASLKTAGGLAVAKKLFVGTISNASTNASLPILMYETNGQIAQDATITCNPAEDNVLIGNTKIGAANITTTSTPNLTLGTGYYNSSLTLPGASGGAVQISSVGLNVNGALSKNSGSFKIPHPLPSLNGTHQLVHSFIEGPQADCIYRGKVNLVGGSATVNIDEAAGMTQGTFLALCRDIQCFTFNESNWDLVRGSVNGNLLTIESQDQTSTATISWMVIGERKDQHMYDTAWTDENGKVIVEPLNPTSSTIQNGITWTITRTTYETSNGFIKTADWTATAIDGNYTALINNTCSWEDGEPTIPYTNVTMANVLDWCWSSGVDKIATETMLAEKIALQKNPVTSSGTPWSV